jgi:Bacterial protein of unknown function (Gcw_chp)
MLAVPAFAEEGETAESADTTGGSLYVASDYRFRGTSYSDGEPSIGLTLTHALSDSVSASVDAASVQFDGQDGVEVVTTLGWNGSLGAFDLALEARAGVYGGIDDSNYAEVAAILTREFDDTTVELELSWAPLSSSWEYRGSRYARLAVDQAVPDSPVSLNAAIGWQSSGHVADKIDWEIGALVAASDRVELYLAYVGTDKAETTGRPSDALTLTAAWSF